MLRRATTGNRMSEGNFMEAIAPMLVMAQCFAIMPVVGVNGATASELRFSWKALRTIYSIITCMLAIIYTSLTVFMAFRDRVEFDLLGELCSMLIDMFRALCHSIELMHLFASQFG